MFNTFKFLVQIIEAGLNSWWKEAEKKGIITYNNLIFSYKRQGIITPGNWQDVGHFTQVFYFTQIYLKKPRP